MVTTICYLTLGLILNSDIMLLFFHAKVSTKFPRIKNRWKRKATEHNGSQQEEAIFRYVFIKSTAQQTIYLVQWQIAASGNLNTSFLVLMLEVLPAGFQSAVNYQLMLTMNSNLLVQPALTQILDIKYFCTNARHKWVKDFKYYN